MKFNWQSCRLGDVLELKRGYDLPKRLRQEGPYPIISSSGQSGSHAHFKVEPPGVVTGRYGTLGEVFYITKNFWPLNTALYVRDFKNNDALYVSYLLKTVGLKSQNAAGAVPGVNRNHLHELMVEVPPLLIQRRMAGILSTYDDLIEVNRRRIKALEEMARRTYEEWFERNPGENWKSVNFEDIANIHRGKSYRSVDLAQSKSSVPLINLKNIQSWGGFRLDGFKSYSGDAKAKHYAIPGDLLLAVTDMTQERRLIAECAKVPKLQSSHAVFSMDLVKVIPKEQVEKTFFYGFLRWSRFSRTLKEFANGANVLHLSPKAIAAYRLALPPMELQLKYSKNVQPMLQLMESLEEINANLRDQRDLLLPRLISGEIDVSDMSLPQAEAAE